MIRHNDDSDDNARKPCLFRQRRQSGKRPCEVTWIAGQRPCDRVSNPVSLAPIVPPGLAVPSMSWKDFLAWVLDPRVHIDPALCRHQVATGAVNSHRVALDAFAFCIIGCEHIELSRQSFTAIPSIEVLEEPSQQLMVSARAQQMPGGSSPGRLSSKRFHVHAVDE